MGKTAKHINRNAELLKAMDTVVRFLNDEDGMDPWFRCGLPDGWNEDDLVFMAEDDDMMDWACKAFRSSMRHSAAGWYTHPFEDTETSGVVYGATD